MRQSNILKCPTSNLSSVKASSGALSPNAASELLFWTDGCTGSFYPQRRWKIKVTDHSFGCFTNQHVFLFCNLVLLRVVGYDQLPLNSYLPTEIIKTMGCEFSPLFVLKAQIHLPIYFSTSALNSLNLLKVSFLDFWKINPSLAREIIYEDHVIRASTHGGWWHRPTCIWMYQI